MLACCVWRHKDINLKAIHNQKNSRSTNSTVVSDDTKILIWKQFTTSAIVGFFIIGCVWRHKDINLKAIHNQVRLNRRYPPVVSDDTKILIWKQFTTNTTKSDDMDGCVWRHKDINLKAIHNRYSTFYRYSSVVSDDTKILIWKQFTTQRSC